MERVLRERVQTSDEGEQRVYTGTHPIRFGGVVCLSGSSSDLAL